ncbi:MAG: RsmB/NOP family class I SAM-dependent RNA methyltransferase [Fusicatenibacter sp.]
MRLPEMFLSQMKELLGEEEFKQYITSFDQPICHALRANTSKISPDELKKRVPFKLEKIPWIPNGFYYEEGFASPTKHPYYHAGLYYLQEPSAMTPASRLPIEKGDQVLDLCAAPGGKATELASRLDGTGMLLANDISHSRAKALLKNLENQGFGNILVTSEEPQKLVNAYPEHFDKILLDAPCSGEGMFRREPSMIRFFEENGPNTYVPIQKKLTEQAYQMLKPGGMMLYSTCTFSVEENESVIEELLRSHEDLALMKIQPDYEGFFPGISVNGRDLSDCVRIFPHRMRGEGHFLALLQKKESERSQLRKSSNRVVCSCMPCEAREFLGQIRRDWSNGSFRHIDEQLYFLAEQMFPAKGLRYLRTGLHLGTIRRGRFEPSQVLAMNLKPEEFPVVVPLCGEDERVLRYLKGETIDLTGLSCKGMKGWALVCVDGYPLGFGKIAGQMLKNKYYTGWRMT